MACGSYRHRSDEDLGTWTEIFALSSVDFRLLEKCFITSLYCLDNI